MEHKKETLTVRLKNLRAKMEEKGLESVLITKRESYIYLSGFTGTAAFLVVTAKKAVLITDFRYVEQASQQAPLFEIVQYSGDVANAINDVITAEGISRLGFEEGYVTYEKYNEYKEKLKAGELVPLGGMIESLRIRKDAYELDIIRKAVEIADQAFSQILGFLRPGITESEVAAELEYQMKKKGARGASFDTIVASGERAALPHGVASNRVLQSGDVITMDFGAIFEDYCSDMTRTVFLGQPDGQLKKIYEIVLEAQLQSSQAAKAGLTGKEIDAVARNIISGYGFEKNFGHGLGHGVGLEIHEDPRVSTGGQTVMENGMIITIEPGIYVPGLGGVRIEDMLVIHDDTPIVLTTSTKELLVL